MKKLKITTTILAGMIGGIIVLLVYESNIVAQVEENLNTVSMHPCELTAHELFDLMDEYVIIMNKIKNYEIKYSEQEYYANRALELFEKQKSLQQKMDDLKCFENTDEWVTEELALRYDQSAGKFFNSVGSVYYPQRDNPFRMLLIKNNPELGTGSLINTCPVMISGMTEEEIARYYEILEERPECKELASKK